MKNKLKYSYGVCVGLLGAMVMGCFGSYQLGYSLARIQPSVPALGCYLSKPAFVQDPVVRMIADEVGYFRVVAIKDGSALIRDIKGWEYSIRLSMLAMYDHILCPDEFGIK